MLCRLGQHQDSRRKFEVYVCTAADWQYAMEVWRLLDFDCAIIPFQQLRHRVVSVPSSQKTLARALGIGNGQSAGFKMPLALIVDDRKDVSHFDLERK